MASVITTVPHIEENDIGFTINDKLYVLNKSNVSKSVFFKTLIENIGIMETNDDIHIYDTYGEKIGSKYIDDTMKWLDATNIEKWRDVSNIFDKLYVDNNSYKKILLCENNDTQSKNNNLIKQIVNYYYVADFLQIDKLKILMKNKINRILKECTEEKFYVVEEWNEHNNTYEFKSTNGTSVEYVLPFDCYYEDILHEKYDGDASYFESYHNMMHIMCNKLYLLMDHMTNTDRIKEMLQQYSCEDKNPHIYDYHADKYLSNNDHLKVEECFDNLRKMYYIYETVSVINLKYLTNMIYPQCALDNKLVEELLTFDIIEETNKINLIKMLDTSDWIYRDDNNDVAVQWKNIAEANGLFEKKYSMEYANKVGTFLSAIALDI